MEELHVSRDGHVSVPPPPYAAGDALYALNTAMTHDVLHVHAPAAERCIVTLVLNSKEVCTTQLDAGGEGVLHLTPAVNFGRVALVHLVVVERIKSKL